MYLFNMDLMVPDAVATVCGFISQMVEAMNLIMVVVVDQVLEF